MSLQSVGTLRTLLSRRTCAGLAAAIFVGAPASAALLPATATLDVSIATYQVGVSGSGFASSNGGAGSLHTLPAGFVFNASAISAPISPTFTGLDLITVPAGVQNGAGSFGPDGAMGLSGTAFFYGGLAIAGQVPLAPIGGGGSVPMAIGPLNGTLQGATWMGAGGPTALVFSAMSAAIANPITAMATAYDNRTSGGMGTVQLVAPAKATLGILGSIPVFGVLTISYTPEPGTLTLLGSGTLGLAALGWRRRQASRG